jgi:hypothetical protein
MHISICIYFVCFLCWLCSYDYVVIIYIVYSVFIVPHRDERAMRDKQRELMRRQTARVIETERSRRVEAVRQLEV